MSDDFDNFFSLENWQAISLSVIRQSTTVPFRPSVVLYVFLYNDTVRTMISCKLIQVRVIKVAQP